MEDPMHIDATPQHTHRVQNAKEKESTCGWHHQGELQEDWALELDLKPGYWAKRGIPGRSKVQGDFGDSSN